MRTGIEILLDTCIRIGAKLNKEIQFDIVVRRWEITGVDLWISDLNYLPYNITGQVKTHIACNSLTDAIEQLKEYEQLNTINNG